MFRGASRGGPLALFIETRSAAAIQGGDAPLGDAVSDGGAPAGVVLWEITRRCLPTRCGQEWCRCNYPLGHRFY